MTWALVDGTTIIMQTNNQAVILKRQAEHFGNQQYSQAVFSEFTAPQLAAIGLLPVQHVGTPDPIFFTWGSSYVVSGSIVQESHTQVERSVADIQVTLKQEVHNRRNSIGVSATPQNIGGTDYEIDSNTEDMVTMLGILSFMTANNDDNLPAGFDRWRDRVGLDVPITTGTQFRNFMRLIVKHRINTQAIEWDKSDEIDALATHADLVAYDLEADWPAVA